MLGLNPAYRNYRIKLDQININRAELNRKLSSLWQKLNRTDFADRAARAELKKALSGPEVNPYAAGYFMTSLGVINNITRPGSLLDPQQAAKLMRVHSDIVGEMALHRIACDNPFNIIQAIGFVYGPPTEKVKPLFFAVLQNRYQPNPSWLQNVHQATSSIVTEATEKLISKYSAGTNRQQTEIEAALVAAAINSSDGTFQAVLDIVKTGSIELAERLEQDRQALMTGFAYHFTREELLPSIAEKGLSAQYAPSGSEQPEVLCFNNRHTAGIEHVNLGISGYYIQDFLLRIKVSDAPFSSVMRGPTEEIGDYTADYLLDKKDVIPPEKIEIVDPLIATRAIPLVTPPNKVRIFTPQEIFGKRLTDSGYYTPSDQGIFSLFYDQKKPSPLMPGASIPPLRLGDSSAIRLGEFTVFTGGEKWGGYIDPFHYKGLHEYIITPKKDRELSPIYLFDNHNHALFGWLEAFHMGLIEKGSLLIHIDTHDDLDPPPLAIQSKIKPGKIPRLAEGHALALNLWVTEFIRPAFDFGLFKKMHSILSPTTVMVKGPEGNRRFAIERYISGPLGSLKTESKRRIVVDIDLDFTVDLTGRVADQYLNMIREIAKTAGVVTIATSPSCIDQTLAMERAQALVESL
jgi:hypothetical protein